MSENDDPRYAFTVEWFDPQASLLKQYNLLYWPQTQMLEMYDIKNRRTFLKKTEYPSLSIDQLFVGATLTVYSRQPKVLAFADPFTTKALSNRLGRTTCVVKASAQQRLGAILQSLSKVGFQLARLQMVHMVDGLQKVLVPSGESAQSLEPGLSTGLEIVHDDAVESLKNLVASSPSLASDLYVAESQEHSEQIRKYLFETRLPTTAAESNCTMVVIKPHVISKGETGQVLDAIASEGLQVAAAELFYLDRPAAEEFLDVYKGVIPQYCALVEHWTSGASLAVQVVGGENIVEQVRELAGPHDPEIGRHIRPQTLRARFGIDRVRNGVHATDLHEDGTLESEFFFKILQDAEA